MVRPDPTQTGESLTVAYPLAPSLDKTAATALTRPNPSPVEVSSNPSNPPPVAPAGRPVRNRRRPDFYGDPVAH